MLKVPSNDKRGLRERASAAWPEDATHAGTQNDAAINQRLYMQYFGVLTLLGDVCRNAGLSASDRGPIEQAFVDANVILRRKGSAVYYEKSSGGGYSAFME